MLGISWGIVSVVVLLAYGDGFSGALDAGFAGAFSDGVAVTMMGQTSKQAGGERAGKRVRITIADVEAIARAAAGQRASSPEFMKEFPVVYGNRQSNHWCAPWPRATARCAANGRSRAAAFSTTRTSGCTGASRSSAAKCSASCSAAFRRSAKRSAIGGQPFEVIGVMEEKVQMSNYNRPDEYCVFIPWTTMSGLLGHDSRSACSCGRRCRRRCEPKAEQQVRE